MLLTLYLRYTQTRTVEAGLDEEEDEKGEKNPTDERVTGSEDVDAPLVASIRANFFHERKVSEILLTMHGFLRLIWLGLHF